MGVARVAMGVPKGTPPHRHRNHELQFQPHVVLIIAPIYKMWCMVVFRKTEGYCGLLWGRKIMGGKIILPTNFPAKLVPSLSAHRRCKLLSHLKIYRRGAEAAGAAEAQRPQGPQRSAKWNG